MSEQPVAIHPEIRKKNVAYSKEIADYIIDYVAAGGTVRNLCDVKRRTNADAELWSLEKLPYAATVYAWVDENSPHYRKDFAKRYMAAERIRSYIWRDQVEDWSNPDNIETEIQGEKGLIPNSAEVTKYVHCVATRRWLLEKADQRRYGATVAEKFDLKANSNDNRVNQILDLIATGKITPQTGQTLTNIIKSQSELGEIKELNEAIVALTKVAATIQSATGNPLLNQPTQQGADHE